LPTQGLGEGGPRHVAGVAVAHGVGPRHVLHVGPLEPGVGQRLPGRHHAVLHEVAAPLAPRVHPDPDAGDLTHLRISHQATTFHFHTTCSPASSSNSVERTSSTSAPTRNESASPSTWPITTSFSSSSSTAATE